MNSITISKELGMLERCGPESQGRRGMPTGLHPTPPPTHTQGDILEWWGEG